jgi:hypothetical protein
MSGFTDSYHFVATNAKPTFSLILLLSPRWECKTRNKMFQEINWCEDSDDNGEWLNTNVASHPMISDSNLTIRNDGSATKHSKEPKPASNESRQRWRVCSWEDRLSELADYCKIHGHCNVPHKKYSKNTKLSNWVQTQRKQYRFRRQGKVSFMTNFRIHLLEEISFEWNRSGSTWEDRLSELVDYRKLNGHCNVPKRCIENSKLGTWVSTQRSNYWLHVEGKPSPMTLSRIQALESVGFEWKPCSGRGKGKPSLDDDATRVRERAMVTPEHVETTAHTQEDIDDLIFNIDSRIQAMESVSFEWKPCSGWGKGKPSLDEEATRLGQRAVEAPEHVETTVVVAV